MEADRDQLYENLLKEIEAGAYKKGDQDLVHRVHPGARGSLRSAALVIRHGREERNFNREPPDEDCAWYLELLAHISPLLRVVGEQGRYQSDGGRQAFGDDSSAPQSEPYNLQPDHEPFKFYSANGCIFEQKCA